MTKLEKEFLRILKRRKTPIKADELVVRLGIKHEVHTARRRISYLRRSLIRQGILIVSNKDGYYLARTEEDIQKYIHSTKKRAFTIFKNLRDILRAMNELDNIKIDETEVTALENVLNKELEGG